MRVVSSDPVSSTKLILLGTKGGPKPSRIRSNPANLLIVGGRPILVDCGYGVTRQLLNAGISPHEVRTIFITHHHSDHTLELGPLLYNAWVGGLREPVDVWGPPPLRQLIDGFVHSMSYDIGIRIVDEGRSDLRRFIHVHEIDQGGVLIEGRDLRVSATRVRHPPVADAYAYRFDTADRSVVLSGDTAFCPELVTLAQEADVLVHEVMHLGGIERLISGIPHARMLREHLVASHTTTDEVGKVAASARVKRLILTHFVPGDDPSMTDEMWFEGPRRDYGNSVCAGRDLQIF